MRRCKKCVMADTRPRITLDKEGVCAPCRHWERKEKEIDWNARREELKQVCDEYRRKDGKYDCVIPVSGGKDSAYVAWKIKHEFGMHPLCVTFAGDGYTEIGRKNLDDFIASGFDHVLITPNGRIHKKFVKKTFIEFGDCFLPFIYGQMAGPFRIAVQYKIPLIIYGEDGEVEYGGVTKNADRAEFSEEFVKKYLYSTQGLEKWVDDEISLSDLQIYMFPSAEELKRVGIKAVHFSYYDNWQPYKHYLFAKEHTGYTALEGRSEGTYTNYASLDDIYDGFHYYLMYPKFGWCRATSDAAHEIREHRITREEGIEFVRKYDGEFPKEYFKVFLRDMKMSEKEFWEVVESFINPAVWEPVGDKEWESKDPEIKKTLKIGSKE